MNVIFGGIDKVDGQPMFWNNKDGWGVLASATKFTDRARAVVQELPKYDFNDAVWVKLQG